MKRAGFRARAACSEGESCRRRSVRCQWTTTGPELDDGVFVVLALEEEEGFVEDLTFDFGGILMALLGGGEMNAAAKGGTRR